MNGKGSSKRPTNISDEEFDKRWSAIDWGSKEEKKTKKVKKDKKNGK